MKSGECLASSAMGAKPGTSHAVLNAQSLEREIAWFEKVMETRFALYFQHESPHPDIAVHLPPDLQADPSPFARLVRSAGLGTSERLVLVLALIPHLRPQLLDSFFVQNSHFSRGFTEFGGITGTRHGGFLPTGETAVFLIAGSRLDLRFHVQAILEADAPLSGKGFLRLEGDEDGEPSMSRPLRIQESVLNRITSGGAHRPEYSARFPARRLVTPLTWDDLVLPPDVEEDVAHVLGWIRHQQKILSEWRMARILKPGYRVLFHGPPGTGKTLTASLMGVACKMDVYRIDLSMMVSKYIGETEKNLAGIFDQALHQNWILFFDEADALFGKRTQATTSNDRHANQETAYLLQRIEAFPGVVVLATNMKANLDEAFFRRFQSAIHFPVPDVAQRARIWEKALSGLPCLDTGISTEELAEAYVLAGGAIVNAIRFAAVRALNHGKDRIFLSDLRQGVRKELRKEGKTG